MAVAVPRAVGEESAVGARVAALYDEHARMVLLVCRAILRDGHEAEDAAQQTFLSAYRALLGGTRPDDARRWLAAIARNECRARLRKRAEAPIAVDDEVASAGGDPVELARERERLDALKAAVSELPDRQRQAVVLRDFHGFSYDEVAAAMSVSPPVVEALLARGRGRVRRALRATPRFAAGALPVPATLREQLARLIPGFDAAMTETAATGAGGAAAAGVLGKLASLPLGGKLAAGAAAVSVGIAGAPQVERALHDSRPPAVTEAAHAVSSGRSTRDRSSGPSRAGPGETHLRGAGGRSAESSNHRGQRGPSTNVSPSPDRRRSRSSGPGRTREGTAPSVSSSDQPDGRSSGSGDSSGPGGGVSAEPAHSSSGSPGRSGPSSSGSSGPSSSGSSGPSSSGSQIATDGRSASSGPPTTSSSSGSETSGPGNGELSTPGSSGASGSSGSGGSGSSGSGSSGSSGSGSGTSGSSSGTPGSSGSSGSGGSSGSSENSGSTSG